MNEKERRRYDIYDYTEQQLQLVIAGMFKDDKKADTLADIRDLDPLVYDIDKMYIISISRGSDTRYGNIEDIKHLYDKNKLEIVASSRGSIKDFGSLSNEEIKQYDADKLLHMSKHRAKAATKPLVKKKSLLSKLIK